MEKRLIGAVFDDDDKYKPAGYLHQHQHQQHHLRKKFKNSQECQSTTSSFCYYQHQQQQQQQPTDYNSFLNNQGCYDTHYDMMSLFREDDLLFNDDVLPIITSINTHGTDHNNKDITISHHIGNGQPQQQDNETQHNMNHDHHFHEKRRRKVYLIPRIMKTDIRRQYATMLANVYNSQNKPFLQQFLSTYFHPNFQYFQMNRKHASQSPPHLQQSFQQQLLQQPAKLCYLNGLITLEDFWFEHMHDTPDLVFKLGKTQFKLKSDNTGSITFQCSITGTLCSLYEKQRRLNEMVLFRQYNLQEIPVEHYVPDIIDPFGNSLSQLDDELVPSRFMRRIVDCELRKNPQQQGTFQYSSSNIVEIDQLFPFVLQGLFVLYFDEHASVYETKAYVVDFSPR